MINDDQVFGGLRFYWPDISVNTVPPRPSPQQQEGGFLVPETIRATLISHVMQVPTELLRDYVGRPSTSEERAEHERQRQERQTRIRRVHANLLAVAADQPMAVDLLTLHAPNISGPYLVTCEGCDWGGYEGESPEWPCRTYGRIAERLGYPIGEWES